MSSVRAVDNAIKVRRPSEDPALAPIRAKIERGERLTLDDGERLFATPDIWSVCEMAHAVRRRLHGDAAYYNINRHLNYSNVCALSCKFCEFYRKAGQDGAYTRDMEYVRGQVREAVAAGATEIHSVGGLHLTLPFSYYTDLVSTIREEAQRLGSELHVKAFTAVEVVHFARVAKVYRGANVPGDEGRALRRESIRWVLSRLKDAGLGSLPGGGAEVFDDRVHDEAYKGKIRSDVWLDVHRVAHELGLNTNATLLYGHIEHVRDRVVHMEMLRRAQDEALARLGYAGDDSPTQREGDGGWVRCCPSQNEGAGGRGNSTSEQQPPSESPVTGHLGYRGPPDGDHHPAITLTRSGVSPPTPAMNARGGYYQTIIPLPFFPDGSELEHLPGPAGLENLRTLAVARLMLDNFPHVKAFWIMQTLPMAELMLQSGADDIDGTVVWYDITKLNHANGSGAGHNGDGAATHQEVSVRTLEKAIRDAGFRPIERDTLYRRVVRDTGDGRRWRAV